MVLPLLKVGSLMVKSLAKPFSKQIKMVASRSPVFHKSVVAVARGFHKIDIYLSRFTGELGAKRQGELNVNAAIDLGAEMASEFFLLSVAVGLLLYENNRSSQKEQKKEEVLQDKFQKLEHKIQQQNTTIEELKDMVADLQMIVKSGGGGYGGGNASLDSITGNHHQHGESRMKPYQSMINNLGSDSNTDHQHLLFKRNSTVIL